MKLKIDGMSVSETPDSALVTLKDDQGQAHELHLNYDELVTLLEHASYSVRAIESANGLPRRSWQCRAVAPSSEMGSGMLNLDFEFGEHGYFPVSIPAGSAREFVRMITTILDNAVAKLQ
jgi:hypothetical protein